MKLEDKKVFFILSPHINLYHSYRGDSRGMTGFGKDLQLMRGILDKLDEIEDMGFSFGDMKISWDYADIYWSIQLQKEYQQDVLDRVIERCKMKKDEVVFGSWGNVAQPILDTEELLQDQKWFQENSMGIGVRQLFKGRVAPYARTQETMFTQGMIEVYNKLGIEGICIYYSVYQFDVGRPFINPRLDWNQRYGPINFKSVLSDSSILMIPMYGFGDVLDYCSIKRWFKLIRNAQKRGDIKGHALIFLNFDMDYDLWLSVPLPSFLRWMPNSRGLLEFAEAVDQYDYVEFANLIDTVPKMEIRGETILRQDAADGNWNGFYSWAQKYDNTKFWTVGQWARWLKCMADTLISAKQVKNSIPQINEYLREGDDQSNTYLRNKILFASTTNFGLSMPFQHPQRRQTAMTYGLRALYASLNAMQFVNNDIVSDLSKKDQNNNFMTIFPITKRGISEAEVKPVINSLLINSELPADFSKDVSNLKEDFKSKCYIDKGDHIKYAFYEDDLESILKIESIIPVSSFEKSGSFSLDLSLEPENEERLDKANLISSKNGLKNKFIMIEFNENGKIISFKYKGEEYACPKFLDSAVTFGEIGKEKRFESIKDDVRVIRDGSDGFSASIKIDSKFEILPKKVVHSEKILKLYSDLPYLFIEVSMDLCDIRGEEIIEDGTSFVQERYDKRWLEVMPCEVKPNILGKNKSLRIWKHNFLGKVSYFDLDMKEIDAKNADLDCLVANITDGWMGISNGKNGLLIGYNGLKAANFAFTPIKMKDKGFGDCHIKAQQVRINPFGTYYGKDLHYWTLGTGHGQKYIPTLFGTLESSAPTFNGKKISFEIVLIPYKGDAPPEDLKSFLNHNALPPLILFKAQGKEFQNNYSKYKNIADSLKREFTIEEMMNMSYIEWVRKINEAFDPIKELQFPKQGMNLDFITAIRLLIDGIRGR